MNREEILDEQFKELSAMSPMTISMPPDRGYMLAAIVQTASICLDLPETTKAFCKEFVQGFCDRYRDQMPTVVKVIEEAWEDPKMMTEDEFAEVLGEKWRHIADEVEAEMNGEIKITVDKPHQGALCPVDGEPCSKGGNFYYYPNDCPAYEMCEHAASRIHDGEMHDEFFSLVQGVYEDIDLAEDDRDPSGKPCPCGEGTTTLRDCDGRPCGFYKTHEHIPMCPPEISKELGYEEDDDYITIITRKDDKQLPSVFSVAPPNHDPETYDY